MKYAWRILLLTIGLCIVQQSHAQPEGLVTPYDVIATGIGIGKAITQSIKDKKKRHAIEDGRSEIMIDGIKIIRLRVPEKRITSKAKVHVLALQKLLDEYYQLYINRQHINIPRYNGDLTILRNLDKDWPSEYYETEMMAYKEYEYMLWKKQAVLRDSIGFWLPGVLMY